jgi:hypothetical protein
LSARRVKKGPGWRPQSAKRQQFMELRSRGWSPPGGTCRSPDSMTRRHRILDWSASPVRTSSSPRSRTRARTSARHGRLGWPPGRPHVPARDRPAQESPRSTSARTSPRSTRAWVVGGDLPSYPCSAAAGSASKVSQQILANLRRLDRFGPTRAAKRPRPLGDINKAVDDLRSDHLTRRAIVVPG